MIFFNKNKKENNTYLFVGFGNYENLSRFWRLQKFGQEFQNLIKKANHFVNYKTVLPETLHRTINESFDWNNLNIIHQLNHN